MRALKLVGGAVACLVALVAFVAVADWFGQPTTPDGDDAARACEQRIETQLKSPASAKFSGTSARPTGELEWLVTGLVDSDNTFGASLRSQYGCTATYADGEWSTSNIGIAP